MSDATTQRLFPLGHKNNATTAFAATLLRILALLSDASKDSKKYAATGGWGFGDFTNGKPGKAALMKTCFSCHVPAKDQDFVFTRYTPEF